MATAFSGGGGSRSGCGNRRRISGTAGDRRQRVAGKGPRGCHPSGRQRIDSRRSTDTAPRMRQETAVACRDLRGISGTSGESWSKRMKSEAND